jgi:hypothetical protein
VHEFRRFLDLPRCTGGRFEVALDIDAGDHADRERLLEHGWSLVDPLTVAADPWMYRDYVARSFGELMIAKNMYVQARSGWFSDRSIGYLASGRPVLAQDTGLAGLVPTGEGLLTFTAVDEAADAYAAMTGDYERHARAARALACEYFDSDVVLARLLAALGLPESP